MYYICFHENTKKHPHRKGNYKQGRKSGSDRIKIIFGRGKSYTFKPP